MIISFGSRETRLVWEGRWVNSLPIEVQEIARRKLRMLHVSTTLQDLLIPPSNRLEKLQGDLKSYYSIRINRQWRLIFKWTGGHAEYVKIIDYH
jgi:proteic killer suppression protein